MEIAAAEDVQLALQQAKPAKAILLREQYRRLETHRTVLQSPRNEGGIGKVGVE